MPRQARIDAPGALHHIMIRGIERRKIFQDDTDRDNFLDRLGDILTDSSTACYAWAVLPNHAHFLLRTGTVPLATVMRRLLTGYAVSFNRRHNRQGLLFQNRYKSILCQEDPYLLELVRYIHLNPLRARIMEDLPALDMYPYAGHSVLLGKKDHVWQDTTYILKQFDANTRTARRLYRAHVENGIAQGSRPDLIGGGLIRSMGGWAAIKRGRTRNEGLKGDERILGDSAFVTEVLVAADEQFERTYRLKAEGYSLDDLARQVASIFEIPPAAVTAPGKYRHAVKVRSVFCYWAVRELGESATALAKRLKLSQPAVSISVKRGETLVKEMGITFQEK